MIEKMNNIFKTTSSEAKLVIRAGKNNIFKIETISHSILFFKFEFESNKVVYMKMEYFD